MKFWLHGQLDSSQWHLLMCLIDLLRDTGRPVFLDLTVKVKEKWRKSEDLLNELGY